MLLILYDATMRYLFSYGLSALQELEWHLFDAVFLLGIAYAMRRGAHVRVDLLYDRFSPQLRRWIDIVSMLFFILPFSLMIIYVGYGFVEVSYLQNEASSDPGGLGYRWIVKSLILIAFALLALQTTSMLIKQIAERDE